MLLSSRAQFLPASDFYLIRTMQLNHGDRGGFVGAHVTSAAHEILQFRHNKDGDVHPLRVNLDSTGRQGLQDTREETLNLSNLIFCWQFSLNHKLK